MVSRFIQIICLLSLGPLSLVSTPISAKELVFLQQSKSVFNRPHDLVIDASGRYLYVADTDNHEIKVLDPYRLKVLGQFGKKELKSPHDVTFDNYGLLLVADTGNDAIVVYRVAGNKGNLHGRIDKDLNKPKGMTVDVNNLLYVTNSGWNNVTIFNKGIKLQTFGALDLGRLHLKEPQDIEVARNGNIYITDSGNNAVHVLDHAFEYQRSFTRENLGLNKPKYLDIAANGVIYVADQYNNQIKMLDEMGNLLGIIGYGHTGPPLTRPAGVETNGEYVWVSDTYNNRVLLYRWQ